MKLADETILQLPGVLDLRNSTPFLDAACKRGARLKNGRPVGQMKIWHWCGNDIVRYHLARVDLAHLVLFAGEGIPSEPIQTPEREVRDDALTKWGWRMEQYYRFRKWEVQLDEVRGLDGD